jgi:hypothetical protein
LLIFNILQVAIRDTNYAIRLTFSNRNSVKKMRDFFAALYELLKPLYGSYLADHLYGMDEKGGFTNNSLYVTVGLWLFISVIAFTVLYYFVLNSLLRTSRYNSNWWWLGTWLVCVLFNFFLGYYLPYLDFDNGDIPNKTARENIGMEQIMGFGMANALFALVFFFILSWIVKRWSINASTVPFRRF